MEAKGLMPGTSARSGIQQAIERKVHLFRRCMNPTESSFCCSSVALGLALVLTGCGNQSTSKPSTPANPTPPATISITLDQSTVTLQAGAQQQFKATVKGSSNT